MRALHLLKTSVGATWAWRQIRELVRLGVEVHVALPPGGLIVDECRRVGAQVHLFNPDFTVRRPGGIPGAVWRLRQLVRRVRPNIIHSHFVGTTLTMRLALRGLAVPRLFQVPGPLHLEHWAFRRGELALAEPVDAWVGSCRLTCETYRRAGVAEERVFLSYYGVDVDRFVGGAPATYLGLDGCPVVGMVAYLYAPKWYLGQSRGLKGHEDLIDAVALCRRREPRLRAVFIGGAWNNAVEYERRVREYARRHCGDAAIFLGTRPDVAALYRAFDVAVHPSHSENVGGVVESLLCGVPTIAAEVGGMPDVVRHGDTGWLVPPRRPDLLADAILEVLGHRDEAARRVANGRRLAQELFDVRRTALQLKGIYEQLVQ